MKYERQKIDSSVFFGDEIQLHLAPSLPRIEFKKGRTTYSVTDLRCLNEAAVNIFMDILKQVCETPNLESVSYKSNGTDKDKVDLISDVLMGISCGRKSRAFDSELRFLVSGVQYITKQDGEEYITYELIKDNTKVIYEFAASEKELGHNVINYYDLAYVIIENTEKRMKKAIKKGVVHFE